MTLPPPTTLQPVSGIPFLDLGIGRRQNQDIAQGITPPPTLEGRANPVGNLDFLSLTGRELTELWTTDRLFSKEAADALEDMRGKILPERQSSTSGNQEHRSMNGGTAHEFERQSMDEYLGGGKKH